MKKPVERPELPIRVGDKVLVVSLPDYSDYPKKEKYLKNCFLGKTGSVIHIITNIINNQPIIDVIMPDRHMEWFSPEHLKRVK